MILVNVILESMILGNLEESANILRSEPTQKWQSPASTLREMKKQKEQKVI